MSRCAECAVARYDYCIRCTVVAVAVEVRSVTSGVILLLSLIAAVVVMVVVVIVVIEVVVVLVVE